MAVAAMHPGSIANVNGDGTYSVGYDDGDVEHNVPESLITAAENVSHEDEAATNLFSLALPYSAATLVAKQNLQARYRL